MITCEQLCFEPRDDGGMRVYRVGVLDVVVPMIVWQQIILETRVTSAQITGSVIANVTVAGSIGTLLADRGAMPE